MLTLCSPPQRRQPAPVYLLIGEPFQTEAAGARADRSARTAGAAQLQPRDSTTGAAPPIGPILDSLRTPSLLGGHEGDLGARADAVPRPARSAATSPTALFAAWDEERAVDAAEKLLALAALAGWTQDASRRGRLARPGRHRRDRVVRPRPRSRARREALDAIRARMRRARARRRRIPRRERPARRLPRRRRAAQQRADLHRRRRRPPQARS